MIPRRLITFWLGGEPPEGIKKCIASQKKCAEQFGYEHWLITLDNCIKDTKYIEDGIKAKKYVKVCDMLKMIYLQRYGGFVMDADLEILPNKNFDHLLDNQMVAAREENKFVGYSLVGAVANHPLTHKYIAEVESKFKGDDDKNFESSMQIFTPLAYADNTVKVLEPDYWFPYNHQLGTIKVTENTIGFHHFYHDWKPDQPNYLPSVTLIIPHLSLGNPQREEGLKRVLKSINTLYYPKHLLQVIVEEGEDTVPNKVKNALLKAKYEFIAYLANDTEMTPYSLYNAIKMAQTTGKGLIAFNTGELLPDKGNICTHFIIKRDLIHLLENGEIFSTSMVHVGVDNWLWEQCKKLGQAERCENAVVHHYHFSKGETYDSVYEKGWTNMKEDRKILEEKLKKLQYDTQQKGPVC